MRNTNRGYPVMGTPTVEKDYSRLRKTHNGLYLQKAQK